VLSLDCSREDSLLNLKRQITAAASTQLGLDWPVSQQQLLRMANAERDDVSEGDGKLEDAVVLRDDSDAKSLQSLDIGDGDVLALLIENQVRFIPVAHRRNDLFSRFSHFFWTRSAHRLFFLSIFAFLLDDICASLCFFNSRISIGRDMCVLFCLLYSRISIGRDMCIILFSPFSHLY
jgi:hypothetical protein